MLILRDYTKLTIPSMIQVTKEGTRVGKFDTRKWVSDNLNALKDSAEGVGLRLDKVLTSMSGVLINRRVYPGVEWEKAAPYFADRPYLMHHADYNDAVGRISEAEFEQVKKGNAFLNDWKRPQMQGLGVKLKPSGVLYTSGFIGNPETIIQIHDKRILHVSQGSSAATGACSICDSDWAKGDYCAHMPGRWYNDKDEVVDEEAQGAKLAYLIIRDLVPKEVSFVNDPALKEARILEFSSMTDSEDFDSMLEKLDNLNPADKICLEQDLLDSRFTLTDREGEITYLKLVDEKPVEITTPQNHNSESTPDISLQDQKPLENPGVKTMEWETKYAEAREQNFDLQAKVKDAEVVSAKLEATIAAKDAELESVKNQVKDSTEKLESSKSKIEDLESANKKLLNEIKEVYLDRYEAALKISRPDLSAEDTKKAREEIKDNSLDSIKLLMVEKEKFAKAPLTTTPSKVETKEDPKNTDSETKETKKEEKGEFYESDFDL